MPRAVGEEEWRGAVYWHGVPREVTKMFPNYVMMTIVNRLKPTLHGWNILYVNYISIKLQLFYLKSQIIKK